MDPENKIVIVGGGLAGLTCAIHLLRSGFKVTLIEKKSYPHHKVCGEYLSNEVVPYLRSLDIDLLELNPKQIKRFSISSSAGKMVSSDLSLGGLGISRSALDHFLYKKAVQNGCTVLMDSVSAVEFMNDSFIVTTHNTKLNACLVIGAYGKRSIIDQKLQRVFFTKRSSLLATKFHLTGDFPDDLVALHNFSGGYCGISKVEDNEINVCYITTYNAFKASKTTDEFIKDIICQNPHLEKIFKSGTRVSEMPLSIAELSFEKKEPVYDHILMIGDTAGLIHPLCGNGMAMAIHSAKICAELIIRYMNRAIGSRAVLEDGYRSAWNRNFRRRITAGRLLAGIVNRNKLFNVLLNVLVKFPSVMPFIIKQTHGNLIK
ncbi:NAD(P)/FAD-dependent oxidoreductase [Pedobacter metabolipauper]|uniref:Flavin-dependent dehydrogenase n=1 Tax=Pedobacter metabolipauper TaxID=425513 RepID=A0A4R6SRS1_9SPHI|nr:NAD(P)/FAD-dependent oxidoreductase [Pedobacter metabolipauper]TDQ06377.1 flavin-dependent dehydrogenase [Pedobacter metabolipauper]